MYYSLNYINIRIQLCFIYVVYPLLIKLLSYYILVSYVFLGASNAIEILSIEESYIPSVTKGNGLVLSKLINRGNQDPRHDIDLVAETSRLELTSKLETPTSLINSTIFNTIYQAVEDEKVMETFQRAVRANSTLEIKKLEPEMCEKIERGIFRMDGIYNLNSVIYK